MSLAFHVRADDSSPPQLTDEEIKAAAFARAEAARKAFEESGQPPETVPAFDPSFDPEQPVRRTDVPGDGPRFPLPPYLNPNLTELERVEAEIRDRARSGEDKQPHCYYGPVSRRVSATRLREIALDYGPTDAAWLALMATDDDPDLPAVSVVVPSPNGPTCGPDVDNELRERRDQLLEQQKSNE